MDGDNEVTNEFDVFVNFCFEHGGTLRNHKAFGEMARNLKSKISALEARLLTMRAADDEPRVPFSGDPSELTSPFRSDLE